MVRGDFDRVCEIVSLTIEILGLYISMVRKTNYKTISVNISSISH